MTTAQLLITIGAVMLATLLTRFLPFFCFPDNRPVPAYVVYLGKVLPYAVIGMLVVYCLKGVSLTAAPFGLPEWIAIAVVVALHAWKGNTLLSIGAGTALYMVLVQVVFS